MDTKPAARAPSEQQRDKVVWSDRWSNLERCGYHLPLLTDSMIGGEIARRVEAELGADTAFLPILWIGASTHHSAFAGTVTSPNDLYIKVIEEVIESPIRGGFQRIFLLDSHVGNVVPANMELQDVQLRYAPRMPDLWLTFASWFATTAPATAQIEGLYQGSISHACEWETSMIQEARRSL